MDIPAAINIIFGDRPKPESGRFVKGETDEGRVTHSGEWQPSLDGCWKLRITALPLVTTEAEQVACVDPEDDLLQRILGECRNTELSAIHAAGVLHTAALLMGSQTFNLTNTEQEGK